MDEHILSGEMLLQGGLVLPWKPARKVVLVGGCFDIIHYGHLIFLQRARALGDLLVVALENDDFIQQRKGRVPFHTHQQRATALTHLRSVDYVVTLPSMQGGTDYGKLVCAVRPTCIAVSAGDPVLENKREFAASVGATVVEVSNIVAGLSSSTILNYAHIVLD